MQTEATVEKYRALFSSVANPQNWELPTRDFETFSEAEAKEMQDAIVFFVGGAAIKSYTVTVRRPLHPEALVYTETEEKIYVVSSKGYYHFIGA